MHFPLHSPSNFCRIFYPRLSSAQQTRPTDSFHLFRSNNDRRRRAFSRPDLESSREFYMRRGRTHSPMPHRRKSPLSSLSQAKKELLSRLQIESAVKCLFIFHAAICDFVPLSKKLFLSFIVIR